MDDEVTVPPRFPILRVVLGTVGGVVGGLIVVLAVTVGHCSAFGGRCPADPPPLWDDDVFGMSFTGALIAVAVPIWLARPGWRQVAPAIATGVPAALLIALAARAMAAG